MCKTGSFAILDFGLDTVYPDPQIEHRIPQPTCTLMEPHPTLIWVLSCIKTIEERRWYYVEYKHIGSVNVPIQAVGAPYGGSPTIPARSADHVTCHSDTQ